MSWPERERALDALRAENERLRAELAEWEVENGMNRTFIRHEMGRLRAVLTEIAEDGGDSGGTALSNIAWRALYGEKP